MTLANNKKRRSGGKLQLKWVRSAICTPVKHKLVIKGLGFTRLNQVSSVRTTRPFAVWWRRFRTWWRSYKLRSSELDRAELERVGAGFRAEAAKADELKG